MNSPRMIRIKQKFEPPMVRDISDEITVQIQALKLQKIVNPEESVGVACSSRGIANYGTILKEVVWSLKKLRLKPFLFPAMGSHGGATGEGQRNVLENYGITEENTGAPIRSSMEVVQIEETEDNVPVYMDKNAFNADHIVLVNRVKPHTEFEYKIESGLMKMIAIGLGKEKGARIYHQAVMIYGYPRVIMSVAQKVLQTGKILFGVGVVENAHSQTARIGVMGAEELEAEEMELLKEAKRLFPSLPFEKADLLIIDEMGKDISGTGFDTKVVGRILMPLITKEPKSPKVKRIVVCDLTKNTEGNATGVGIADFVTQRLVDKIDMKALHVNALAGAEPEHARIPLTLPNDREAIKVAIDSVGLIPMEALKIIRIKNTMNLREVEVSEAYKEDLVKRNDLEAMTEARSLEFDQNDNLMLF